MVTKSPKRSAPKKNEIEELRKEVQELRENKKKTRKLIDEMASFQAGVGTAVLPYQKVATAIFTILIIAIGIGIIAYSQEHNDFDDVPGAKRNFLWMGIALIAVGIIVAIGSYFWFNAVKNNRSVAQMNALAFEAGFARNIFNPRY